jgi:hypothetical protein
VSAQRRPPRDPLVEVGEAQRQTLRRANHASPPLRPRQLRVLNAVVSLTATWSRLSDRISTSAVADEAGLFTKDGPDSKLAGRELGGLAKLGLIVYQPGSGRPSDNGRGLSHLSFIGLPPAEKGDEADPPSTDETWVGTDPPSSPKTWVDPDTKPGSIRAGNLGRHRPPTREDPRSTREPPRGRSGGGRSHRRT